MIRDRLRALARRARERSTTTTPSSGIGTGFREEHVVAFQQFVKESDAAFSRLEAVLEPLGEPARAVVAAGLERGAVGVRNASRKGVEAGRASGQLGHATAPIAAALRDAAAALEAAWTEALPVGAPDRGLESLGVVRDAAGRFGGAMARLPAQPELGPALAAAMDRWEGMSLTGLERAVTGSTGPEGT